MIIVEGLDNTGKTTLIDNLRTTFYLRQEKSPGRAPLLTHLEWIVNALNKEDTRIIYDRYSVISERVYGTVLRGGSIFKDLSDDLIRLTMEKNPLIIYCRPHPDKIFDWGDRPQMKSVKENARALLDRYDNEIWQISHRYGQKYIMRYSYEQPDALKNLHDTIESYFKLKDAP